MINYTWTIPSFDVVATERTLIEVTEAEVIGWRNLVRKS